MVRMRLSLFSSCMALAFPRFMSFVVEASAAAPVEPAPVAVAPDVATEAAAVAVSQAATSDAAPATVTVEVPAQHVSLIKRAVALLEKGEAWITDNVHAGIQTLENLTGDVEKKL